MIKITDNFKIKQSFKPIPKFKPGQLVQHKRYAYRGVVVGLDLSCKASEGWYQSNKTQPDQKQPWYHVLVDTSEATTYAAESSLELATSKEPVDHPLVDSFFSSFKNGKYRRNGRPWK